MLKKTAAFGSLLTALCASATLAHGSNFKSGFLAGAHVGYSFGSGKFNSTLNLGPNLPFAPSSVSASASKSGPLFGILGGYRHIFNQGYTLGANLEINIFGTNELNKQLNHVILTPAPVSRPVVNRLKRTFSVIPSVVVGKIFCDRYHVSLGLGLAFSRFKQQATVLSSNLSVGSTQTKMGIVPSIGVEYAASKNVSLTGNFSYEMYPKSSKTYKIDSIFPGATYASSIKPRYATLKVGAVYRF